MRLEFSSFDLMTFLGICIAVVSMLVLRFRSVNKELSAFRILLFLFMLVLISRPAIVKYSGLERPLVAIAVDVSDSMFISGRIAHAIKFVKNYGKDFSKKYGGGLYAFASTSGEIKKIGDIKKGRFGNNTDLRRSLWDIRRESGENLAGILVISDFNHNSEALSQNWVSELNVPVFPVAAGTSNKIRDASVESLRVSDFAFKNTPVDVIAGIKIFGYGGSKAVINLKGGKSKDNIIASRNVNIPSDNEEKDIEIRFTPEVSGEFKYAVEINAMPGEITQKNNRREFTLSVIRDKLRVLYLCGQPGPEYAFLRHCLKNDPLVELVSFVILRNPENIALVPENDLSLIPFPVHDIFTRDIYDFDVLILENFTYQRFGFMPEYLSNIRTWIIDKGGGMIMIGGANSFASGGWGKTPVEDILPASFEEGDKKFDLGFFRPVVENYGHYITDISGEKAKNEAMWQTVPELDGCQALNMKTGAETLMRHPFTNHVVLSCWEKGKGRVVALGSNTTWRWALGSDSPHLYTQFWRNIVRYLARSAESDRLNVFFDRDSYASNQKFIMKARTMEKVDDGIVQASLIDPSGESRVVPLERQGQREWIGKGTLGGNGIYKFQVQLLKQGVCLSKISVFKNVNESSANEETILGVNEKLAGEIAEDSNARAFTTDNFSIEQMDAKLKKIPQRTAEYRLPLWPSPIWFFVILAVLLGEWFFRKYKGYL